MASKYVFRLLLFVCFQVVRAQQNISLGSSLSPTSHSTPWHSPSGRFAFGFYRQRNSFMVGIWLAGNSEKIIVWTANRDDPPVSSNTTLELTMNGLLLRTENSGEKLIADLVDSASSASMLDSGNFVLYNKQHDIIWESFDFPTDTILGGQILPAEGKLISNLSATDCSTGRYQLSMQDDGNLVLYPQDPQNPVDAYWSSNTMKSTPDHLYLNYTGTLLLVNTTSLVPIRTIHFVSDVNDTTTIYRAILEAEGMFRLYSHSFDSNGKYGTSKHWEAPENQCEVKSFCGFNSYCTFMDNQPDCNCLDGTDFVNRSQKLLGCQRNFTKEWCKGGKENPDIYNITSMKNIVWDDRPYFAREMSIEDCKKSCLEDCNCEAALFAGDGDDKNGYCQKQKLPLKYARRDQNNPATALFKVGTRSIKRRNGIPPSPMKPRVAVFTSKKALVLVLVLTLGFVSCLCIALAISRIFIFKYRRLLENENLGLTEELTLRSFSYNELKKATNGFKEELGRGSFGAVYKGTLHRGKKLVAVKRLEKMVNEGEREFRAEMRVIGRTHHRNLVRLFGYCAEDTKRLLVYEYMSNGSLADLLFRADRPPDWNERMRMALDVAKGILYLHEECEAPIIHCDIKPQNILMDDFWTAKISDFGLAKLLMPDQTRTFTGVRGTRGYLAPEWQQNIPISVKADIYSFGIALLELVCCRRNMEINVSNPEEIVLSTWVYKCFVARELEKLVGGEEVEKKTLEKMVKVGLWCIQEEPALRPSMKSVVLMLKGITEISIPPCPTTTSM